MDHHAAGCSLRAQFEGQGFVGPIRAVSEAEAAAMALETKTALKEGNYVPAARRNRHFDLTTHNALATNQILIDTLREIYSEDLVIWRSHVFSGRAGSGLGWHRDFFHSFLDDPEDHLSVHFAITPAPEGNCVMVVPGSHKWSDTQITAQGFGLIGETENTGYGTPYYIRHSNKAGHNSITLAPGEFFIFHPALLHASVNRIGAKSSGTGFIVAAKKWARGVQRILMQVGLTDGGSRLAVGLRICRPQNRVSDVAFGEWPGTDDTRALISGQWRGEEASFVDWT
ncbi:phytanoyl-CoA dioxygenase family protein [bacterium AH-315-P15]|nr:phytanoyl-CoA dioxygenase family protein [bacterium AH-315-P15]